ncbi:MAG: hypothetical protein HOP18_12330 [Deltaproteobacteria bacterium]|nr:hypothetical protein [Deltaproteobacteria bacterium]
MKREFILQADIEGRDTDYSLSKNNSEFVAAVRDALETSLPKDMREIYDMRVDVHIKAIRTGSLSVFFAVAVLGLSALSRYKNLYDSVELIRTQADTVLESLKDRFGDLRVSVTTRYPHLHSPYDRHHLKNHELFLDELALPDLPRHRRDAFFYFLLAWSIISLIVIGLLVYAAVRKTYFP